MENSNISWCDHTFNAWKGCTKVSPGCKHCFAESQQDHQYHKVKWGPQGARIRTTESYWKNPIKWNKGQMMECTECGYRYELELGKFPCPKCESETKAVRQRMFCASLADIFEDNPQVFNWRCELFRLIERTPHLDWLLLTKRPEKIFSLGTDAVGEIFDNWMFRNPNVWLGTSVEDQEYYDLRVNELLDVYSKIHFLSIEPILGPVKINPAHIYKHGISWVIVGGESGPGFRPMQVEWAQDLHDQCKSARIPFFMKQDAALRPGTQGRIPDELWNCKEFPDNIP